MPSADVRWIIGTMIAVLLVLQWNVGTINARITDLNVQLQGVREEIQGVREEIQGVRADIHRLDIRLTRMEVHLGLDPSAAPDAADQEP